MMTLSIRTLPLPPLKQLICDSEMCFITGDHFRVHHWNLHHAVDWPPLAARRTQHLLLYGYKAILQKLPNYPASLITRSCNQYQTRSQDWLAHEVPKVKTKLEKTAFNHCAHRAWNGFQETSRLNAFQSL